MSFFKSFLTFDFWKNRVIIFWVYFNDGVILGNSECKVMLTDGSEIFSCSVADSFFLKLQGIMFQRHFPYKALLFRDSFWMHSFFCFVEFNIVFLDENFNVIQVFYKVKPNKILPPVWGAKYVIEYFDNSVSFEIGQKLVVEGL